MIELVKRSVNLDDMIAKRVEFLTDYQNAAYAARYKSFVDKVRAAEAEVVFSRTATRPDAAKPSTKLTEAVARYLFKLMAYKDEYEVARLHADPKFLAKVAAQFEGKLGKDFQLALPPGAADDRQDQRQGRAAEAEVRPVDADGVSRAGAAQGPARHGRSIRSGGPRSGASSAR